MPLHPEHRLTGVILALLIGLPVAHGQDSSDDSTAPPVEIVADSAEVDDAEGVSVYRGDVVLTRGTLRIKGDVMHVYANDGGQLERATVDGEPATYRQTLDDSANRRAEAPRMEYFAAGPERLVLRRGGRLWQGDNIVTGRVITHYPQEDRTVAERGGDDDERVNVSVTPASD